MVVRLLVADDESQLHEVETLLHESHRAGETMLLHDAVLCETLWVIEARYGLNRRRQAFAIRQLLDDAAFAFEDREVVERALTRFKAGRAGFADYLIGEGNARRGAAPTHTFDKGLRAEPGFTVH